MFLDATDSEHFTASFYLIPAETIIFLYLIVYNFSPFYERK